MARLTLAELKDTSRYTFEGADVECPELGGSVYVKALSVGERDELPELVDENGKPDVSIDDMADMLAQIVADPKMSKEDAHSIIRPLPATAYDRIVLQFYELLGSKEDRDKKAREFQPPKD